MKFQKKTAVVEAYRLNASMVAPDWLLAARDSGVVSVDGKGRGVKLKTEDGGSLLLQWGDVILRDEGGVLSGVSASVFDSEYRVVGESSCDPWSIIEQLQGQIAAEIRVMLGEGPYDQAIFDDAQRQRRIKAMQDCAANSTGDAERHESWMKMHLESGWVYGEEFDPQKKTHPNLKPWDELPPSTRSKARIFDFCAKAAKELSETCR